jgi:hypothetical protein
MRSIIIIIILLVTISVNVHCQSKWTKLIYGDKSAYGRSFIESYDHGLLLLGTHGHNAVHYNWLIKTDINGNLLWEKTIGNSNSLNTFGQLAIHYSGNIFLVGITTEYDADGDPIIMKIDSCGEKQWCRIFYSPDNMDYSNLVVSTDDGGCVAVLMYTGNDPSGNMDRLCCVKFSAEGELNWKECYNSQDTLVVNKDADHIMMTKDKGFIISGICHYKTLAPPHILYNKPYFLKIDSNGIFEWETVAFKEMGAAERGHGWTTAIDPTGQYYYSSISHYKYNPYSSSPAIIKMDLDGNIIEVFDLVNGYIYGGLAWAQFINDTILAGSASWGNHLDSARQYAVLFDTLGNIVDSTLLSTDIYGPKLQVAYDDKLLYMYNTFQNDQFDVYLTKLNYNLESDTFYSYPFKYDSLCPYPIESDTISQEGCDIIVGIDEEEEEPRADVGAGVMELFPNPASNEINCRLSTVNCQCVFDIYDIWGRKMDEIIIPKGQELTMLDVSSYPVGIYIAVLKSEKKILEWKKFIVQSGR